MHWLVLLFVLAADPPTPTPGEEIGAKTMFEHPLGVFSFSSPPNSPEPVRKTPPAKPVKQGVRNHGQRPPEVQKNDVQEPVPQSEPKRAIGIRFWVQRVDDHGKVLDETAVGHIFRSGERIQLLVESNTEGYLAVVQQGADGRSGLLFPGQESELGTQRIPARSKVVLPDARHSFTFDQQAGTERLFMVFVRDREELAELPLRREMGPAELEVVRRVAARELGAKNLITQSFAEDDPSGYAVNRAGSAVVQEIALVHEK
jgi:uncharacterized protein DUF4384